MLRYLRLKAFKVPQVLGYLKFLRIYVVGYPLIECWLPKVFYFDYRKIFLENLCTLECSHSRWLGPFSNATWPFKPHKRIVSKRFLSNQWGLATSFSKLRMLSKKIIKERRTPFYSITAHARTFLGIHLVCKNFVIPCETFETIVTLPTSAVHYTHYNKA